MSTKMRIQKLEKQKPVKVLATWKDFIRWANGDKTLDAEIVKQLENKWKGFVEKVSEEENNPKLKQLEMGWRRKNRG